jgi:hypothetical protein
LGRGKPVFGSWDRAIQRRARGKGFGLKIKNGPQWLRFRERRARGFEFG